MKYIVNSIALNAIFALIGTGLALNLTGCAGPTAGEAALKFQQPKVEITNASVARTHDLLARAFSQVGTRYRYGGVSPETGFDCSGFIKWVYEPSQLKLPRRSRDLFAYGQPVKRQDLRPGDLVFFGRNKRITHVGIYTGDNQYIHSPSRGKNVQESSLDDRSRGEYYAGARRIIDNEGVETPAKNLKLAWQDLGKTADVAVPAQVTPSRPPAGASSDQLSQMALEPQDAFQFLMRIAKNVSITGLSDQPAAQLSTILIEDHRSSGDVRPESVTGQGQLPLAQPEGELTAQPPRTVKMAHSQHKVMAGDTLFDLSRKYGVSVEAMTRANKLEKKTYLKLGQTLMVPSAGKVN